MEGCKAMNNIASFNDTTPLRFSLTQFKQMQRTAASPTSAPPTPPLVLQVPFPVSGQGCYQLFSTKVQIDSPYRIKSQFLQPFLAQDKKILLVPSHFDKMSAFLTTLHPSYLIAASDRMARLLDEMNRIVLVVFPVSPDRAYVLQTRVSKLYGDRVFLEYRDPRYEPRWRLPACTPMTIRLLPRDIQTALEQEQLHLTRELRWLPSETADLSEGHLTDLLAGQDATQPSALEDFQALPSWSGNLRDISRSGICVSLSEAPPPEKEIAQRLLVLQISLPPAPIEPKGDVVALTLHLVGVIRGIHVEPPGWMLRIQFLERLPEECETLFQQMTQGDSSSAWLT
jgi:hypothetical protein